MDKSHIVNLLRLLVPGQQLTGDNAEAVRTAADLIEQCSFPFKLEDIEQYRMQMAGISSAALGAWKATDTVHPDYDTPALRDVASLYANFADADSAYSLMREAFRILREAYDTLRKQNEATLAKYQQLVEEQAKSESEPTWIVNDLGELGVHVNNRFFFLYKGYSIEYGTEPYEIKNGRVVHSDDTPMKYRIVGKTEFGEVCWPQAWVKRGYSEPRYTVDLTYIPGLSFGKPEDGEWKDLPVSLKPAPNLGELMASNLVKRAFEPTLHEKLVQKLRGDTPTSSHLARKQEPSKLATFLQKINGKSQYLVPNVAAKIHEALQQDPTKWTVDEQGSAIHDGDFTHDSVLQIKGDFLTPEDRKGYASYVASLLNLAESISPEPQAYAKPDAEGNLIEALTTQEIEEWKIKVPSDLPYLQTFSIPLYTKS